MTLTSFVIKTTKALASGKRYEWNTLQESGNVIATIDTGEADLSTDAINRNRLVSGVPTPFARVVLFKEALRRVAEGKTERKRVLDNFLAELIDEWKGLIGLFAVRDRDIRRERVFLAYPGEARPRDPDLHLFDMRGSLGAMLFDSVKMWCDPAAPATGVPRPFIDILFFRDQVIGATSPEVLVFTGVHRGLPEDTPFVGANKRLTDPLKWEHTKREELVALFHFVDNMQRKFHDYLHQFPKGRETRPDSEFVSNVLAKWLDEIRAKLGSNRDYEKAPKPTFKVMASPFAAVFDIDNKLFGANGRVSLSRDGLSLASDAAHFEFAPKELLASAQTTVVEIPLTKEDEASLGVHLLRVDGREGPRFFSLPLSPLGLSVFEPSLASLLGTGGESRTRLHASMDDKAGVLHVTLDLDVDGTVHPVKAEYRGVDLLQGGGRVICWPNFVHQDWREYYLYSEVPHNARGIQAFPLRADAEAFRLLRVDGSKDAGTQFRLAYKNGEPAGPDADESIELIIGVDQSRLNDSDFLYEVYRSERPFKGLALRQQQREAGFIVFRDREDVSKPHLLQRLSQTTPTEVRVGVDFGSNNTCVSFSRNQQKPELITFRNRRRFLLGRENEPGPGQNVTPGEGFFFQNEELEGNTIKSMVTVHDERRLMGFVGRPVPEQIARLEQAVIGGIPFFERNVPVEESVQSRHKVKFGSQPAEILYNMKWSQDERGLAHQRAFLKTLWLKLWAELFSAGMRPGSLFWAVPSAMSPSLRAQYQTMWSKVAAKPPVQSVVFNAEVQVAQAPGEASAPAASAGGSSLAAMRARASTATAGSGGGVIRAMTESNAVSRYALFIRDNVQVTTEEYHIGLDVGGSTTDFLCLVQRAVPGTDRPEQTLIKEGSIRLAAGSLADVTGKAKGFKNALESFCFSSPKLKHVAGVTQGKSLLTEKTAPYYYNLILDRMGKEDFAPFYAEMRKSCPELFILNAFVTGFVMFHAGQLAYRVHLLRQEPESGFGSDIVRSVSIAPYGKGGRIFDWLPSALGEAAQFFYQDAFYVGFGIPLTGEAPEIAAIAPAPRILQSELSDAKREVSFGLAYESGVQAVITPSDTIPDLVGERGYTFKGEPVSEWADVDPALLEQIGGNFKVPASFARLGDFATLFEDFVQKQFNGYVLNVQEIMAQMQLVQFVQRDPEFQRAKLEAQKNGKKFDFQTPLIVLEAMCFLEGLKKKLF